MKRTLILTLLLALVAGLPLKAQSTLSRVYSDLQIDVWTDKDDGANYEEGDEVTIYFTASRDCYVTIFDLDTRGNVNLIFPETPDGANYIEGGQLYELPAPDEDYVYTVSGPPGNEYIQMIASTDPYKVPDWEAPISVYDDYWPFKYDDDADEFIFNVAKNFFPIDDIAYDQVSFYVAPKYYYKRTYSDCSGDCGTVYIDYPQGCEVYVDGIYWGAAPLWIPSIYLGRHRVSVYWGTSIVYNDWIDVAYYDPFFIYPRSHFIYDYTYRHWYPYRYYDYYYGPSKIKYKKRSYYAFGRPEAKPGYEVVTNTHGKYKKSPTYSNTKTKRLGTYKSEFGYSTHTKTYTSVEKGPGTTRTKGVNNRPPDIKTFTNIKGPDDGVPGWKGYGGTGDNSVTKGTKTKQPSTGTTTTKGTGTKPIVTVKNKDDNSGTKGTDRYKIDVTTIPNWGRGKGGTSVTGVRKSPTGGNGTEEKGAVERTKINPRATGGGSGVLNRKPKSQSGTKTTVKPSGNTKSTNRYKAPEVKRQTQSQRKSSGSTSHKTSVQPAPKQSSGNSSSHKSSSVSKKPASSSPKSSPAPKSKSSGSSKKSSGGKKKK